MKIAVIGSGISGLTSAYYLADNHDIHVFESESRIGGHTATVDVDYQGEQRAIDTGFIVYNDWTYPNFINLMNELGVSSRKTEMSFSVKCDETGLEYGGNNLNTMFAQRMNFLSPKFYGMIADILRFNKEAIQDLESGSIVEGITLEQYLRDNRYSDAFVHKYLVPMGCAIWSASTESMLDFPLLFFVRFFKNHGLLSVNDRPQWHVLNGGSRSYLEPITQKFANKIRLNSEILEVDRSESKVTLVFQNGSKEYFDQVIFACHSDQALGLIKHPCGSEKSALSKIPYQPNEVVLHADDKLLPKKRLAWSSWNYWLREKYQQQAVLTYQMNILQGFQSETNYCVTLNATESINPDKIIGEFNYSHPVFSLEGIEAARDIKSFNGGNRTWFTGAYLGNGFHEDGVLSAINVVKAIEKIAIEQSKQPELTLDLVANA